MKRFVQQVGVGVCALALLLSVGGAAALGSSGSAGPVSTAGGRQHWVTLVTGDRVLLQVAGSRW